MDIDQALQEYTEELITISDTPHLDAECLIRKVTGMSRADLFAHPEYVLNSQQKQELHQLAKRRLQGEPIAYILEKKEFWELELKVTPDVLIPRPETECLVEYILEHYPANTRCKVADLGVGSGAIALALAKERPNWIVHATDHSQGALDIARENAAHYQLHNLHFFHGKWFNALPEKNYDIIASNPPYIDSNDKHLKHLSYEPLDALDGGHEGLDDIKVIIHGAKEYLKPDGLLIFEHGYDQREAILNFLHKAAYRKIEGHKDLAGQDRFSTAVKS